jgi:hypothetical protein
MWQERTLELSSHVCQVGEKNATNLPHVQHSGTFSLDAFQLCLQNAAAQFQEQVTCL